MTTTRFWRVPCLAAALCLFLTLAPLHARAQSDYDSVLAAYELTMAKVKAWEQASIAASQALKGRDAEIGADEAGEDTDIDDLAAQLDSVPEIRRAVDQARLSTREFATIGLVLFQAMTMDQMLQINPKAQLPKNMNPANLEFVRAHKAEVQQSFQAVQAAGADADG